MMGYAYNEEQIHHGKGHTQRVKAYVTQPYQSKQKKKTKNQTGAREMTCQLRALLLFLSSIPGTHILFQNHL